MRSVAVIIPYYQQDAGVLTRALLSVFAQDARNVFLTVIVIDDTSPLDPAIDIASAGALPAWINIQLARRPNGGPGAARNTGFDVAPHSDFIALLDSDDAWRPDHLRRALSALDAGFDLYFADHQTSAGDRHFPATRLFPRMTADDPDMRAPIGPTNVLACSTDRLSEWSLEEYIAHTSTLVFRTAKLGHIRMVETLRSAGEDHLFFLDLLLASDEACFSLDVGADLGRGVNIYASAIEWGTERDLRRRAYNLFACKLMLHRKPWPAAIRHTLRRRVGQGRRMVSFLILRRLLAERKLNLQLLALVWKLDRQAVAAAPVNAALFAVLDKSSSRTDR